MGLLKCGGGNDGFKKYFETGAKKDRHLTRDEMDERLILSGDIDICDSIVQSRDTQAERYDHLTFSMKESDVSKDTLRQINEHIKEFITAAYTKDELYYYSEGHLPKTKTEQKYNTVTKRYETVDRLIHLHIIIPKVNLVTGERASAFEMLKAKYGTENKTLDFIDALQESINAKFGLASPDDNKRVDFQTDSDILSRIKEDQFSGKNREALAMIRDRMISEKVESTDDFQSMLEKIGTVTVGHGQNGDYLQVKLHGEKQNIRLKDYQFSAEFVNLPMSDKVKFYSTKAIVKSEDQKVAEAEKRANLLELWKDRSREIKYLSPSSRFYKEVYVKATSEQKTHMLDRLEAAHYVSLHEKHGFINETPNTEAAERFKGPQCLTQTQLDALVRYTKIRETSLAEHYTNIEQFSNARLNQTFLRTSAELEAAEEAGKAILIDPLSAIDELTFSQSHFSEEALERHILKNTCDQEQYNEVIKTVLASGDLVTHQDEKGKMRFTSNAIVEIEKRLIDRTESMAKATGDTVSKDGQKSIIDSKPFNPGQRQGFELLCSSQQLAVVNGAAGTGKSFVLAAMREGFEKESFKVYGAILQGKTAEDLERDSGIQSRTIAKMLLDLNAGRLELDEKSVLVVDEVGMVGSRDLEKLMMYCETSGAKLRLVGDANQLSAVEYGDAFKQVSKRVPVASLIEIMRQKEQWQREASVKFSKLNIDGLRDYHTNGKIHFGDTAADAQTELVDAWTQHRQSNPEQNRIVLAHTNETRIQLNEAMRSTLKAEGQLSQEIDVKTARGTIKMAIGESVMFMKPDRDLGVKNGTTGTVTAIKNGRVYVELENGKSTDFEALPTTIETGTDSEHVTHIDYGYAVTVHKSQGMTVDRAFVMSDKGMAKENLGVAMTRHRFDAHIFASSEDFKNFDDMVKTMDKTADKAFTEGKTWTDSTTRQDDSVISQYIAEINADKVIKRASQTAQFQEILLNLDPQRVLDHVSKSHGLNLDKYSIIIDEAGQKLIKSDSGQEFDVASFLTDSMHLDYKKDASKILHQCYEEQLNKIYSKPKGIIVDQSIPREFAAFKKDRETTYKAARNRLDINKRTELERIKAAPGTRAGKALAKASINSDTKARKATLKEYFVKPTIASIYKRFLAGKAGTSAPHLAELVRVTVTEDDKKVLAECKVKFDQHAAAMAVIEAKRVDQEKAIAAKKADTDRIKANLKKPKPTQQQAKAVTPVATVVNEASPVQVSAPPMQQTQTIEPDAFEAEFDYEAEQERLEELRQQYGRG